MLVDPKRTHVRTGKVKKVNHQCAYLAKEQGEVEMHV